MPDSPSSRKSRDDTVRISVRYSSEGFALVAIKNGGDEPGTRTKVGIWLPAVAMGWDFGPSRACREHSYPGLPYELPSGVTVIFPINLVDMYVKLVEKQSEVRDFVYFATNDRPRISIRGRLRSSHSCAPSTTPRMGRRTCRMTSPYSRLDDSA